MLPAVHVDHNSRKLHTCIQLGKVRGGLSYTGSIAVTMQK